MHKVSLSQRQLISDTCGNLSDNRTTIACPSFCRVSVFEAQSCSEDLRRIEAVAKADVEGDDLDQLETCPSYCRPTRC